LAADHRFRKEEVIIGASDQLLTMTARLARAVNQDGYVSGSAIDIQLRIACIKDEILMVAKFEKLSDTA
jgi:hypothetical protein